MNLNRKRTTFHNSTSLAVHNSVEFFAYGPEVAAAYPIVKKLYEEAGEHFHEVSAPIIQAAIQNFPKGSCWWDGDSELARNYRKCWESYKLWRYEAFCMMQEAARVDTDTFFTAREQHQPQPFVISPTPRSAFEWLLEFGATAWEMFTDDEVEV